MMVQCTTVDGDAKGSERRFAMDTSIYISHYCHDAVMREDRPRSVQNLASKHWPGSFLLRSWAKGKNIRINVFRKSTRLSNGSQWISK